MKQITTYKIEQRDSGTVAFVESYLSRLFVLIGCGLMLWLLVAVVDYSELATVWRIACGFFVLVCVFGIMQSVLGRRYFIFSGHKLSYRWNTFQKARQIPYADIAGFKVILGAGKASPSNSLLIKLNSGETLPFETFVGHVSKYIEQLDALAQSTGLRILDMDELRTK